MAQQAELVSQRTSLVAFVKKEFEGDLVEPSSGNQFLEFQSDFGMAPNFETLENPAIRNDIMPGRSKNSGEAPSITFSHLFVGSGTAGTAPGYGSLIESSFGKRRDLSTEITIAAGSTPSTLKVAAADGAKLKKGDSLRIYNDTSSEIRPVKAINLANTDISLGFDLTFTPVAGDKIGLFNTYYPENDGMPLIDAWHYMGEGDDGFQVTKDCRTVSMAVAADAKTLINCTFGLNGTSFALNDTDYYKITVATGKNQLKLTPYKGVTAGTQQTVSITAKTYTAKQLAAALQTAIRALTLTNYDFTKVKVLYVVKSGKFVFKYDTGGDNVTGFKFDPQDALGNDAFFKQLGFTEVLSGTGNASADQSPQDKAKGTYSIGVDPIYINTEPVISRNQRMFVGVESGDNATLQTPTVSISIATPSTIYNSVSTESGNYASKINARNAEITVDSFIEPNDQRFFETFKKGDEISFFFAGGNKDTNKLWNPGECFGIYGSQATISAFNIGNNNEIYTINMTLKCFSPGDGTGSIFFGFV